MSRHNLLLPPLWLALTGLMALVLAGAAPEVSPVAVLGAAWALGALGWVCLSLVAGSIVAGDDERLFLSRIFWASYLSRVVCCLALYVACRQEGHPYAQGFVWVDDVYYHQEAEQLAESWRLHGLHDIGWSKTGWIYVCAVCYSLFGPETLVPRLLNALLLTLAGPLIYGIGRDLVGPKAARVAAVTTVAYPGLLILSIDQNKETSVTFAVALATFLSVRAAARLRLRYVLGQALAMAYVAITRFPFVLLVLPLLPLFPLSRLRSKGTLYPPLALGLLLIALAAGWLAGGTDLISPLVPADTASQLSTLARPLPEEEAGLPEGSFYAPLVHFAQENAFGKLLVAPASLAYAMAQPFPLSLLFQNPYWVLTLHTLLSFLFWYALVFLASYGYVATLPKLATPALHGVVALLLLAPAMAFLGGMATERMRMAATPLLFLFAGWALEHYQTDPVTRSRVRRTGGVFGAAVLTGFGVWIAFRVQPLVLLAMAALVVMLLLPLHNRLVRRWLR